MPLRKNHGLPGTAQTAGHTLIPSITSGFRIPALFVAILLAVQGHAYEHPLSSDAVRDAYFLGQRSDQKVKEFLDQCIKHLPMPEQGPYISTISAFTPYAQVALSSLQNRLGFSAQQAEHLYATQRQTVQIRIRIVFTATYNAMQGAKPDKNVAGEEDLIMRPQDFWRDFRFEVWQKSKMIRAQNIRAPQSMTEGSEGQRFRYNMIPRTSLRKRSWLWL